MFSGVFSTLVIYGFSYTNHLSTAVRGSKPDLGMWDLWWDKVALGRFSPSTSVSPAIVVHSTNYSTITLIYHPGKCTIGQYVAAVLGLIRT
jgi:hypothetical protein